ncbi:hypothetical protein HYDPIDRAFT_93638, partial [Hydnomerulius pinastri MD-312]
VASLTFLMWDSMLTFSDEVERIWPIPWKSKTKWVYLYLRYVNIASHVSFTIAIPYLTSGHAPELTCKMWLTAILMNVQLSDVSLQLILAFRVYALFNRSRHIASLLCLLFCCRLFVLWSNTAHAIPSASFGTMCVMLSVPKESMTYGAVVPITQSTMLGLICFKAFFVMHSGRGRTPLVSLVLRQGVAVYCVMLGADPTAMRLSVSGSLLLSPQDSSLSL